MQFERASASERRYLPPAVAVSVIAFALAPPGGEHRAANPTPTLWLPLVRRTRAPFLGQWALPGGPIEWNETLTDTATRSLIAATERAPGYLEQLYSFGSIERSAEAQRLVTIAYWAMYGEHELDEVHTLPADSAQPEAHAEHPAAGSGFAKPRRWDDPVPVPAVPVPAESSPAEADVRAGATNVRWFPIDDLPELAFDHGDIVSHAVARLRAKTEYSAVAHRFLGPEFTLGRLREVTEAVLGERVDPANFRRQALARGGLTDTGRLESGAAHRPSRLYRFTHTTPQEGTP